MEILTMLMDAIKEVGFPIACVIYLFWQNREDQKTHKEESAEWVEALNRNTVVMEKILTKIGVDENDLQ